jgi:hypothetical protein
MSFLKTLILLAMAGVFTFFFITRPMSQIAIEISGIKTEVKELKAQLSGTKDQLGDLNQKMGKSILF